MAKAHKLTGVEPRRSYRENARTILPQRVEEVWTWEPFIRDAARREELHNMRISIKRLRYTMELFRVVYQATIGSQSSETIGNALADEKTFATPTTFTDCRLLTADCQYAEFLEIIVDLQEILGDVHDADVVLDVLTDYTQRVEGNILAPGIATLIARTKATRKADYGAFLRKWKHLSAMGFKQKLLSFLVE